jgi:type VI secretion system protein ImpA
MFSIAQLLHPISADRACGEDLSFSSELDAIARARVADEPGLDQGAWVVALKEADWSFVAARCAELIGSRSKDLRLAVWLAEAHAKTRHFRGLGDGYALLAGLCRQHWDDLYPLADDGQYEQRIGNLHWLLARSRHLIRDIPVTDGAGGVFSMADIEAAQQRAAGAGVGADADPELARMEAARRNNAPRFNDTLLADAEYCLRALTELESSVDARLGADGPGFSAAKQALSEAIGFIAPLATAAAEPEAAPVSSSALPSAPALAGPIRARAEALAQLRQVAEFFRRTEPHSPVAYLADKAANWGELPLHLWLRSVVKDPGTIAELEELLGSRSAAEG